MEEKKILTNEEAKKVSGGVVADKTKTRTCPKCGMTYPIGTTHACRSTPTKI